MTKHLRTLFLCIAAVTALFAVSAMPALAHHKDGHQAGPGSSEDRVRDDQKSGGDHDGDADSDPSTAHEDDHDTSDDGDNAHPSGKDRSVENGKSGNQGKAESNPDDSKGPQRYEGAKGDDKPGGPGGNDVHDQDGNNGCGNDDDFDDDNNGHCGRRVKESKPKPTPTSSPTPTPSPTTPPTGTQGGNIPCPSGTTTFKVDRAITNGTYSDGKLVVTVTNATSTSFSWSSNLTVNSVLVKGGPATRVTAGGTSGSASAPSNPNNGGLYGISHVTFCYTPDSVSPTQLCPAGTDMAGQKPGPHGCNLPDDEVCPAGTDMAGQKPGSNGCNLPSGEVCPAGTDMAGLPPSVFGCNLPSGEVCPAGTDMAGLPLDSVEGCNEVDVRGNVLKRCPSGQFKGMPYEDIKDCDLVRGREDRVLPKVIRSAPPAVQRAAQAVGAVLPFTGAGDLYFAIALGMLLIAAGSVAMKLRRN